jgi:CheY-like chemotaxis protein
MLQDSLERKGYTVATASNGRIGIQAYREKSFDVVITDLIMPEMEGLETIINLRKDDPGVKIIAISGGGLNMPEDYLEMARGLGAAKTFSKPIDRSGLFAAVEELVSG